MLYLNQTLSDGVEFRMSEFEEDHSKTQEPITSDNMDENGEHRPAASVIYSCMRCGTQVSLEELSRLPEIKCICGFRVFNKLRPTVVKSLRAI